MMKKSVITFICWFVLVGVSSAQQTHEKSQFDKVLSGLHEIQVREIVGVPSRVEPFVTIANGTTDTTTYWVYPNLYTIAFRNHFVDYIERNRFDFLQRVQQWNNPSNKDGLKLKYGH